MYTRLSLRSYYRVSKIPAHAISVRRVVVVAVAVVVDIREVSGRNHVTEPPVRTYKECPIFIMINQEFPDEICELK